MNELHTNVCFDALSILNNVQIVENVCNICGAQHYTGNCPDYSKADNHVLDAPQQNLSRSSIPNGLIIVDNENGTCVVTSQKFAKGTRFGPLLAPKSFMPIDNLNFPLVLISKPIHEDDFDDIQELFNVRNVYLDTSDENNCNWMIHVNVAEYSNEQNLICYQENNQIYYSANQDIELGDILKVWYSWKYASQLNIKKMLEPSQFDICNNILRQVSTEYGIDIDNNSDFKFNENNNTDNKINSEISLPPINSLMKSSPICAVDKLSYFNASSAVPEEMLQNISFSTSDLNLSFDSISDEYSVHDKLINYDTSFESYISSSSLAVGTSNKDLNDNNKFACEICNRKYVTTANLDKHMRQHNLFMCVTCMKIFEQPDEFKEHDCYKQKASLKNSLHCTICLKGLSNSWSLQRHMKIHRTDESDNTTNLSDDNESINRSAEDMCFQENIENSETDVVVTVMPKPVDIIQSTSKTKSTIKHACTVCGKLFKNLTSLDNHLKKIHTVYILPPSATGKNRHYESVSKKLNNNSNKKAPIKPAIAKALANKLTEKNKKSQKQIDDNKALSIFGNNSAINSSITPSYGKTLPHPKKCIMQPINFEPKPNHDLPKLVPILNSSPAKSNNSNTALPNSDKSISSNNAHDQLVTEMKSSGQTKNTVHKYMKNYDDANNRGIFKCNQCTKVFDKKYHLTRHQTVHENIYYFCPYCTRAPLKAKSSLRKHLMNSHLNEKDEWNEKNFITNNLVLKNKVHNINNNNHNESTKTSQFSQNSSSSLSFESLSVDYNQNTNNLNNQNLTFQNMFLENLSTNLSTSNDATNQYNSSFNNNNDTINIKNNNPINNNLNLYKHCDSKKQTKLIRNNNMNKDMPKAKRSKFQDSNIVLNNISNNHITNNNNNHHTSQNHIANNPLTLDNFFDDDVSNIILYDHQLNTHAIRNPTITTNNGLNNNNLDDILPNGNYSAIHSYDYVNDEKLKNSFDEIQNKLNSDDYLNNEDNYHHHHQINWNELDEDDDDGDEIDDKSDVVSTNKLLNIEDNLMLI